MAFYDYNKKKEVETSPLYKAYHLVTLVTVAASGARAAFPKCKHFRDAIYTEITGNYPAGNNTEYSDVYYTSEVSHRVSG